MLLYLLRVTLEALSEYVVRPRAAGVDANADDEDEDDEQPQQVTLHSLFDLVVRRLDEESRYSTRHLAAHYKYNTMRCYNLRGAKEKQVCAAERQHWQAVRQQLDDLVRANKDLFLHEHTLLFINRVLPFHY